jgi:RimJ/RimL family protein N-acetyltransferase
VTVEVDDGAILLRPLRPQDAPAHKAGEDDEQIRAFEFPGPASLANVVTAIERWQESWRTGGPERNFGVWLPDGATLVGNVSVRLIDHGHVNLSYLVFPAWRRRGFATRACRLALAYAASELGAVRARVAMLDTNLASAGVARALGAVEVGTEPSEGGGTHRVFSLLLRPAASTHPDQPSHC